MICSFLLVDVLFFENNGAPRIFVRKKTRQKKTDWQSVLGPETDCQSVLDSGGISDIFHFRAGGFHMCLSF